MALRNWLHGVLLAMALNVGAATAAELTVVHTDTWPPYADSALPGQGLALELVTTALERAGYTPRLRVDTLERILEGGKLGVYDIFATAWYSDARNAYLAFSKPYLESRIRFIKRKGQPFSYTAFEDLRGVLIGVVQDYAYDTAFNSAPDLIRVSERNLVQNLLKLTQGRIDLTLDDELVLQYEINRYLPNSMATFSFLPKPLAVRGVHIAVSRKHPDHKAIAEAFDKAVRDMKSDGSFAAIVARHYAYIKKPAN